MSKLPTQQSLVGVRTEPWARVLFVRSDGQSLVAGQRVQVRLLDALGADADNEVEAQVVIGSRQIVEAEEPVETVGRVLGLVAPMDPPVAPTMDGLPLGFDDWLISPGSTLELRSGEEREDGAFAEELMRRRFPSWEPRPRPSS